MPPSVRNLLCRRRPWRDAGVTLLAVFAPALCNARAQAPALRLPPMFDRTVSATLTAASALRAGPGAGYPWVAHLTSGQSVEVSSCTAAWIWCDVAAGSNRGWLPGNQITSVRNGQVVTVSAAGGALGLPVRSFDFRTYWMAHYAERRRHGEPSGIWSRPPGPPPVPSLPDQRTMPPPPVDGEPPDMGQPP